MIPGLLVSKEKTLFVFKKRKLIELLAWYKYLHFLNERKQPFKTDWRNSHCKPHQYQSTIISRIFPAFQNGKGGAFKLSFVERSSIVDNNDDGDDDEYFTNLFFVTK